MPTVRVRVPQDLEQALRQYAAQTGRPIGEIGRTAVERLLERYRQAAPPPPTPPPPPNPQPPPPQPPGASPSTALGEAREWVNRLSGGNRYGLTLFAFPHMVRIKVDGEKGVLTYQDIATRRYRYWRLTKEEADRAMAAAKAALGPAVASRQYPSRHSSYVKTYHPTDRVKAAMRTALGHTPVPL